MNKDDMIKVTIAKCYELGCAVDFVPPAVVGPRIIHFGLRPKIGSATKIAQIEGLAGDLAVALHAEDVLVKRMPGHGIIGVYIPRDDPQQLRWLDLFGAYEQSTSNSGKAPSIPLLLGNAWDGRPVMDDLTSLPHLLIAGSTGGGKSVLMRSIIATFAQLKTRDQLRLVPSDTKGVEFSDFDGLSILDCPRCTSPMATVDEMDRLCAETDRRLREFSQCSVRNIQEFNQQVSSASRMPYIVLMIDELADIVDFSLKEGRSTVRPGVDKLDYITRKSRAAGIHVIAGVQRPSVDTVKGVIKNNFPARLTFRMPSQIDSRTVIDTEGAEHLLGVGDCLYKSPNNAGLTRLHTGLATASDIKGVLEFIKFRQQQPQAERRM